MAPEYYLTIPAGASSRKQIYFLDHRSALYVALPKGEDDLYFNNDSVPKEKVISDLSIPV
jgi:hypothetical protein